MNIHNCHFIGATGLFPIEEIITNTSNNLINYNILTSNNLIDYTINTSNNLINYNILTSNNLISYTNTTSNNITSHYNNLLNTSNNKNAEVDLSRTISGININRLVDVPYFTKITIDGTIGNMDVHIANLKNIMTPEYEYHIRTNNPLDRN
jgi:hypothetical protein